MPTNHRTNVSLDDLNHLKQRIEKVAGYLDTVENNLLSSIETHGLRIGRLGRRVSELTDQLETLNELTASIDVHLSNHLRDDHHSPC